MNETLAIVSELLAENGIEHEYHVPPTDFFDTKFGHPKVGPRYQLMGRAWRLWIDRTKDHTLTVVRMDEGLPSRLQKIRNTRVLNLADPSSLDALVAFLKDSAPASSPAS